MARRLGSRKTNERSALPKEKRRADPEGQVGFEMAQKFPRASLAGIFEPHSKQITWVGASADMAPAPQAR
jgi:hypothetical protein